MAPMPKTIQGVSWTSVPTSGAGLLATSSQGSAPTVNGYWTPPASGSLLVVAARRAAGSGRLDRYSARFRSPHGPVGSWAEAAAENAARSQTTVPGPAAFPMAKASQRREPSGDTPANNPVGHNAPPAPSSPSSRGGRRTPAALPATPGPPHSRPCVG